jgi:hypothetical protein
MRITNAELGAALRRLKDRDFCCYRHLCGGVCWADGFEKIDVHCPSSNISAVIREARRASLESGGTTYDLS